MKAIESTDVKNAVEVFYKDWMVLAVSKECDFNAMTISWGQMGELWNKPVVTVYVRDSRYTKKFIDKEGC
jgi:flavin reductase (DIM6/NTAB) family NADH-FMN oxidoreductase RutF